MKKLLEVRLKNAAKVAEKRDTLPILRYVLLEPEKDGFSLRTTNLEQHYQAEIPGINISHAIAVDVFMLVKFLNGVKEIKKLDVEVEGTKFWLILNNARILGMDPEGFPSLPSESLDLNEYSSVPLDKLSWLIKAASKDDKRYNLNGIYVDGENKKLASTDGHRLHTDDIADIDGAQSTIIPRSTALNLKAFKADSVYIIKKVKCDDCGNTGRLKYPMISKEDLLRVKDMRKNVGSIFLAGYYEESRDSDDENHTNYTHLSEDEKKKFRASFMKKYTLELFYDKYFNSKPTCPACKERGNKTPIVWSVDGELLMSRCMEGGFPDYLKVIPKLEDVTCKYTISKEDFVDALKQVYEMTDPKTRGIKLFIGEKESRLTVVGNVVGHIEIDLSGTLEVLDKKPAKRDTEDTESPPVTLPLEVGFCADYLLQATEVIDGDVVINFQGVFNGCLIGGAVVMPQRL